MERENKNSITVYIIAEQFLLRAGIKAIINVIGIEPEVKEFSTWRELMDINISHSCPFVILDGAPLQNDNSLIENIQNRFSSCKILGIGDDLNDINSLNTVISSSDGQQQILDKFQKFFFELPEKKEEKLSASVLSDREVDVLKEVSMGYSNKEIADRLFISINTVITHRKNITEKLEIKTIAGLTVYALMNKLIRPEDSRK